MSLYNCHSVGNNYRIVKWSDDLDIEATYELWTVRGRYHCHCFQANKPSCRHRDMLTQFLNAGRVDTHYFLDFDNWRWVLPIKQVGI